MKKEKPRGKLSVVTADQRSSRLGAARPCVSLTREPARHHQLLLRRLENLGYKITLQAPAQEALASG